MFLTLLGLSLCLAGLHVLLTERPYPLKPARHAMNGIVFPLHGHFRWSLKRPKKECKQVQSKFRHRCDRYLSQSPSRSVCSQVTYQHKYSRYGTVKKNNLRYGTVKKQPQVLPKNIYSRLPVLASHQCPDYCTGVHVLIIRDPLQIPIP